MSPSAAMADAEALRVAADMAVNLGGPEIARVMREVARRLEVYGYGFSVDCPGCGFSFGAEHHDDGKPGCYTCAVCEHQWRVVA